MSNYYLTSKYLTEKIELRTISGDELGGEQSLIVYEAPGSNGGIVINAGRLNKERPLTGKLLINRNGLTTSDELRQKLSDAISQLEDVREKGIPVVLTAPITDNTTGTYLIKSFKATIPEGAIYAAFTIVLTEYRQYNSKANIQNIIGGEAYKVLVQRQIAITVQK